MSKQSFSSIEGRAAGRAVRTIAGGAPALVGRCVDGVACRAGSASRGEYAIGGADSRARRFSLPECAT
ncbi:hypothetical protein [Burkholderia sp. Ac-20379]|uniref:hypothetical protein n=1 Tax=Burkholderia sp. Ac-20379 TaxID=2703900 RepID=UPI00197E1C99|nr:hypothetical protein [Burkholderia sp. Ac-20379]MBN3722792.1 hypothetical protein [Burkholderia sp. Ac-20379]